MTQARRKYFSRGMQYGLAVLTLLAGCDQIARDPDAAPPPAPDAAQSVSQTTSDSPPGAPPGTCWGRTVSPAVVETTAEQVLVKPAEFSPDGTVTAPPEYRREDRQRIITPRVDNWFEVPCAETLTPEFLASLQRALLARGFYAGQITGVYDAPTRAAVADFQRQDGTGGGVLTLATARTLGLIAVARG